MSTAREEDNKYRDTVFNQLDFKGEILDSDKRLFMLIAGVGAGKNYWAKSLTEWGHEDKGYDPAGYRVLLITSRRSTANAQAIKLDADTRFDFSGLSPDGDSWFTQGVVCCTNSYIEWYVKNLYNPDDPRTHIWNVFDFIILDEAHSMAADATFSEAPFHVQSFLRYVHKQTKNCRIILMSGTPEPIEWLYDGEINQKHVKNINLYNTCRHIEPKNVRLLPSLGLVDKIVMNRNYSGPPVPGITNRPSPDRREPIGWRG
ncbi:DEAD/DEAH box helicase family protein, partial [Oscillibacter valericigenes]|uniref:DEAD/DEAH box helicase family protein n=1 Tax=Oscillibacter valericigenes TaxID=351091 RepID=UPI001F2A78AD